MVTCNCVNHVCERAPLPQSKFCAKCTGLGCLRRTEELNSKHLTDRPGESGFLTRARERARNGDQESAWLLVHIELLEDKIEAIVAKEKANMPVKKEKRHTFHLFGGKHSITFVKKASQRLWWVHSTFTEGNNEMRTFCAQIDGLETLLTEQVARGLILGKRGALKAIEAAVKSIFETYQIELPA